MLIGLRRLLEPDVGAGSLSYVDGFLGHHLGHHLGTLTPNSRKRAWLWFMNVSMILSDVSQFTLEGIAGYALW